MSFATPAEFLERYDARIFGDVVRDNDEQATPAELLTDPNLQAALNDASGLIESACLVGERYTPTDLEALTGNSLYHLKRICCDVAMALLLQRRPSSDPDKDTERLEIAEKHLDKLRDGERVFYRGDNVDQAGVPDTTGPTTVDLENLNSIRRRVRNYYPAGALPFNR